MLNYKYIIPSAVLILLGLMLALMPQVKHSKEIPPQEILLKILDDTRFYSTDKVAEMIINKDPSMMLVDVRDAEEYKNFSLPGAINLPLDSILTSTAKAYMGQDVRAIVFYGNGTIYANQAWMLGQRLGYKNLFVMKGGLNRWVETILRPIAPSASASSAELETYQFRRGASQFFGGSSDVAMPQNTSVISIKSGKKKKRVKGGC